MRQLEKPFDPEGASSLDPVSDLTDYIDNGLGLPPASYDALKEGAQEKIKQLQAFKDYKVQPDEQEAVRYRQRLVEGADHADVTWLKLRAYHRAVDQLRAEKAAVTQEEHQQLMRAYEVPVDKVPQELLDMTPAQLAERRMLAATAASRRGAGGLKAQRSLLPSEDISTESEWPAEVLRPVAAQQGVFRPSVLASFAAGVASAFSDTIRPPASTSSHGVPAAATGEGEGPSPQVAAAPAPPKRELRTIYTQSYLDETALRRQIRNQKTQRRLAFWLSFLTVTGACMCVYVRVCLGVGDRGHACTYVCACGWEGYRCVGARMVLLCIRMHARVQFLCVCV